MSANVIFPGRPDYTGPTSGPFGAVHHDTLCEESHDINERLAYIDRKKPPHEIPIRRWNMIYLGGCPAVAARKALLDQYDAANKLLDDQYYAAIKPLRDQYDAANKLLDDQYYAANKLLDDQYYAANKLLDDQYYAARKPLDDQYNAAIKPLDDQYVAARKPLNAEILAYIRTHIPDFPWDGKELVMK